MAGSIWKLCNNNLKLIPNVCVPVRHGHHIRGKPPGIARNLEQRLQVLDKTDPRIDFKVDIGFPKPKHTRSKDMAAKIAIHKANKNNEQLEKDARNRKLLINLDATRKEWLQTIGYAQIRKIGDHYGIFNDLFGDAYFNPQVPINISYLNGENQVPVYYGNIVKPDEATKKPQVNYESDEKSFWTLIMTNPDGHLTEKNKEYVHWFVGNIPGNLIEKGETIVNYLQPFPPKGTGYHRHVFVLYKQEKKLNFSEIKKEGDCLKLEDRTFSTLEFYRKRQDDLTPAGLAFFQADWDQTLTDFYHKSLNMKEPVYEYDFPETYVKPQAWFPLRQAFNLYMDRYRDPQQINKEFLMRKLTNVHPFKPPVKPLQYPNAQYIDGYVPSWLKLEKRKSVNKWGRVNDV